MKLVETGPISLTIKEALMSLSLLPWSGHECERASG